MCVCVCVCVCVCDCEEIVPLVPNNSYKTSLRAIHFNTNRERCEMLAGCLSLGRRLGGDWANT